MTDALRLIIGSEVVCDDGAAGKLHRLIVDPEQRAVTHLDVEGRHPNDGHLVPIGRVRSADEEIHLDCTHEQFSHFLPAQDVQVVQLAGGRAQYGLYSGSMLARMPMFGLLGPGQLMGGMTSGRPAPGEHVATAPLDVVPDGEVDLRGGAYVIATDGHIGHVHGVVVDEAGHLTHLLLGEGHVFARKEVAIPVESVTEVTEAGAHLSLSKADVEALPALGA